MSKCEVCHVPLDADAPVGPVCMPCVESESKRAVDPVAEAAYAAMLVERTRCVYLVQSRARLCHEMAINHRQAGTPELAKTLKARAAIYEDVAEMLKGGESINDIANLGGRW